MITIDSGFHVVVDLYNKCVIDKVNVKKMHTKMIINRHYTKCITYSFIVLYFMKTIVFSHIDKF